MSQLKPDLTPEEVMEHIAVKLTTIIGAMLLAAVSMMLYTCAYVQRIPMERSKYCIEHGYGYTYNVQTHMVTCIGGQNGHPEG